MPPRFALPPVAVFCDPGEPHALSCLDGDARVHADRLSAALAADPAFGGPAERDAGLRAAARAGWGLVRCMSLGAEPVDGESLPTRSHVQGYFRVRTAALSAPQAALHAALVIRSAIADLRRSRDHRPHDGHPDPLMAVGPRAPSHGRRRSTRRRVCQQAEQKPSIDHFISPQRSPCGPGGHPARSLRSGSHTAGVRAQQPPGRR